MLRCSSSKVNIEKTAREKQAKQCTILFRNKRLVYDRDQPLSTLIDLASSQELLG